MAKRAASRSRRSSKASGPSFWRILLFPLQLALAILLPFFLLVRLSVFIYEQLDWYAWLCLLIGALGTILLMFIYLNYLSKLFSGKKKNHDNTRRRNIRLAVILVGAFVAYVTFFLSGSNAKTTEVQGEYYTVHPILRMAVGSVIVFDHDLIITDMSRVSTDYESMGLTKKKNSLHYPQSDGYVHALDLRTNDRPEWRNKILEYIFNGLGFRTLRHTGTDDHLHISLMIHDNPRAL